MGGKGRLEGGGSGGVRKGTGRKPKVDAASIAKERKAKTADKSGNKKTDVERAKAHWISMIGASKSVQNVHFEQPAAK